MQYRRQLILVLILALALISSPPSPATAQPKKKKPTTTTAAVTSQPEKKRHREKAKAKAEPKAEADRPAFEVLHYAFFWTVAEVDGAKLVLWKTEDGTSFSLRVVSPDERTVIIPIEAAAMVGRKLCEFDTYRTLWADIKEEKSAESDLGGIIVGFVKFRKSGLRATISDTGSKTETAFLTHEQSIEFGRALIKGEDMAAFIDARVTFDR